MSQTEQWDEQVRAIRERLRSAPVHPVVFAGSSSFVLWTSLQRDFSGHEVFNAAFGGSTMQQVLQRAPEIILPLHPRQIVLFAGENDIALDRTVGETVEDFHRFVDLTAPVPLLVLSVKPSPGRSVLHQQFVELNAQLKTTCDYSSRASFLDVWTPMLNEADQPDGKYWMRDGIHLRRAAYQLWAELIRPNLI